MPRGEQAIKIKLLQSIKQIFVIPGVVLIIVELSTN